MKYTLTLILLFLAEVSFAFGQNSVIGSWYADTGSEYDVRLTLKAGEIGIMEYRDFDHETFEFHCRSWLFKWKWVENVIEMDGLPWKVTLKLNAENDSLEPRYVGDSEDSYLFKPLFRSTNPDHQYYVERYKYHECVKDP